MDGFESDPEATYPVSPWRGRLGTLALVLVGLVVFELSANPSLGVAVACLKFAMDDVRDGFWLRRSDPIRRRGRAGFWIYLGVGSLRASLIAFLGAVAMAIVAANFGQALGWPKRLVVAQLLGAVAVMLLGMLIATAATFMAVAFGLVSRVKVWVGPEVRRARERKHWPPRLEPTLPRSRNRAAGALLVVIPAMGVFALIFFLLLLATVVQGLGIRPAFLAGPGLGLLICVIIFGGAVFGLSLRDRVESRLVARNVFECWPEAMAFVYRPPIDPEGDHE